MKVLTTYQFDFAFDFSKNFVFLDDLNTIEKPADLQEAIDFFQMEGTPGEHFSWFPIKFSKAERKAAADNDIKLPAWVPLYYEDASYDTRWNDIDWFQGNIRVALHWPLDDGFSYRVTGQDDMCRDVWSECQALWRERQKKKIA